MRLPDKESLGWALALVVYFAGPLLWAALWVALAFLLIYLVFRPMT